MIHGAKLIGTILGAEVYLNGRNITVVVEEGTSAGTFKGFAYPMIDMVGWDDGHRVPNKRKITELVLNQWENRV